MIGDEVWSIGALPERMRLHRRDHRSLPEFNLGWFDALRLARKEWLLGRVQEIQKMTANEQQAALLELSDIDLAMIAMKRTKLEVANATQGSTG